MKIELIKQNEELVGWDIIPETQEDEKTICVMRNEIFFGFGENHIEYAGRSGNEENKEWPIDKLMWRKRKYKKY